MDHAVSYGTSTITVPVYNYRGLRIAALQSIVWQSKLPKSLFEAAYRTAQ